MKRQNLYGALAQTIIKKQQSLSPLIIGINGIDGSGKTCFAKGLSSYLGSLGKSVCIIHIDDFHNPKAIRYKNGETSPYSFYNDSINYEVFIKRSIKPIYDARSYPFQGMIKAFDLDADCEANEFQEITEDTIILVEGIFLFKPNIAPYLHLKIFIEADQDITLERMKIRDIENASNLDEVREYEQRCLEKYRAGQKLYFTDVDVHAIADIVINNNDYKSPVVLKGISRGM